MSDTLVAAAPATPLAAKAKKSAKPSEHPKYNVLNAAAVAALKERGSSSCQAILMYILANYKVSNKVTKINARLKIAIKAGVKASYLKQAKGTGASGSFQLGKKKVEIKAKVKKVKKPKAAQPKTAKSPKKAAAKKPKKAAAEKSKSPKKPKVIKPKKAAKSLDKKDAKPKKAKNPKKTKAAIKKPKA